jgi:hypothetical protein
VRLNSSAISNGFGKNFSWLLVFNKKREENIMIEQTTSQNAHKSGLQRQIRQTRDSLRDTVEQIQDTAEQKFQVVKKTVSDVLDYREEFQKEPVVWTLGALSAGFAVGYTVGYSHKLAKNKKGSQFANFADAVVNDLSNLGQRLVLPELNATITELFGFNFGNFLQQIGGNGKQRRTKRLQSRQRQTQPKRKRRKKSA